jgi:hypothetical protein
MLCTPHTAWLAEDAVNAAALYDELEYRLVGGQGKGDKVSGTPGARYPDQRAIDARTDVRHTLASWCRLIAEERGATLPEDELPALGEFVARHASWLAAQPFAAEASDELHDLAHGKPRSVAYPSGSSRRELHRDCPMDECDGKLMAVMRPGDSLLPPEVFCSINDEHRWASSEWRQLDRLVSGRRAA